MPNLTQYLSPYLTPFVQVMIFVACAVAFTLYAYIKYWNDMRRAQRAQLVARLTEPVHVSHVHKYVYLGYTRLSPTLENEHPRTILWRVAHRICDNRTGLGLMTGAVLHLSVADRDAVNLLMRCRDQLIHELVEHQRVGIEMHTRPLGSPLDL